MSTNATLLGLQAQVNQIKAVVQSLAGAKAKKLRTVDFAVDMFDRPDADMLSPYWELPGGSTASFGLRSGTVVSASGDISAEAQRSAAGQVIVPETADSGFAINEFGIALPSLGGRFLPLVARYQAAFSAPPIVQIKFTLPGTTVVEKEDAEESAIKYRYNQITSAGIFVGSRAANSNIDAVVAASRLIGYTTPALSASHDGDSAFVNATAIPTALLAYGLVGNGEVLLQDFSQSIIPTEFEFDQGSTGSGTSAGEVLSPHGELWRTLNLGSTNTLRLSVSGNQFVTTLNGVVVSTVTSGAFVSKDAVGIALPPGNMASYNSFGGFPASGITEFKAWRADIPEPPSQSGHGTFAGGNWTHTDRYHKGGGYTPLA